MHCKYKLLPIPLMSITLCFELGPSPPFLTKNSLAVIIIMAFVVG